MSARRYVPVTRGGSCFDQARPDPSPQSQVRLQALQTDDKLNWRIQRADAVASAHNRGARNAAKNRKESMQQLPTNGLQRRKSSANVIPTVSTELLHIGSLRKSSKPFIGPPQPRIILTDEEVQDYLRLAPRRAARRARDDIVRAGLYEPPRAPVGQAGMDRSGEKEKLQEAMAGTFHLYLEDRDKLLYSSDAENVSAGDHNNRKINRKINDKFTFEELVDELREREEFQSQMEQLGHANEYSQGTRGEIVHILNMMKNTDREKFVYFMNDLRKQPFSTNSSTTPINDNGYESENICRSRQVPYQSAESASESTSNLIRAKMQHDSVAALLHS